LLYNTITIEKDIFYKKRFLANSSAFEAACCLYSVSIQNI